MTTTAELTDYVVQHKENINAANTCLLIDIMLPGNEVLLIPGVLSGEKDDAVERSRRRGFDVGLLFYERIIMPHFSPPLPVIFFTSITDPTDVPKLDRIRKTWSDLNVGHPRVEMLVKHPGVSDVVKILEIFGRWKLS